jgi:hypothetical protein
VADLAVVVAAVNLVRTVAVVVAVLAATEQTPEQTWDQPELRLLLSVKEMPAVVGVLD